MAFVIYRELSGGCILLQNLLQNFMYVCDLLPLSIMAHTKLYLDMRGNAKDGKGSLLLMIFHHYTQTSIPLGIRLKPENFKHDTVVGLADSLAMNTVIAKKKSDIDIQLLMLSSRPDFEYMTAAQLKRLIAGEASDKPAKHLVSTLVSEYMAGDMSEGTRTIYKAMFDKVKNFSGIATCVEDIDLKYIRNFDKFLAKTLSVNGRAIYLRDLKTIVRYAINSGVQMPYPFTGFQIKTEPTKKRSVPVEKLREFYSCPCTKSQARYRDYFFLMFFLRGISPVDLFNATHDMVYEGRLEYSRIKTHSDILSVKIEPEAQELLDKYAGVEHLVEVMDHCKHYKNFLHAMNDALGEIGHIDYEEVSAGSLFEKPVVIKKINPVVPDITAYYARHCWATFAHELGISSDIVGLSHGHSTKSKVTWIYIKPDLRQVDEANRAIIDYFFSAL